MMSTRIFLFGPLDESRLKKIGRQSRLTHIPLIQIQFVPYKIPKTNFSFCLLTSKHSVLSLKVIPRCEQFVFIGRKSYETFAKRFGAPSGVKVLERGDSQKVLKFFRSYSRKGSIFFPHSARTDFNLIRNLRKNSWKVTHRSAYRTLLLRRPQTLESALRKATAANEKLAFLFTAPSTFKAFTLSLSKKKRRELKSNYFALGPTTAAFIRQSGHPVKVLPHRDLERAVAFIKGRAN